MSDSEETKKSTADSGGDKISASHIARIVEDALTLRYPRITAVTLEATKPEFDSINSRIGEMNDQMSTLTDMMMGVQATLRTLAGTSASKEPTNESTSQVNPIVQLKSGDVSLNSSSIPLVTSSVCVPMTSLPLQPYSTPLASNKGKNLADGYEGVSNPSLKVQIGSTPYPDEAHQSKYGYTPLSQPGAVRIGSMKGPYNSKATYKPTNMRAEEGSWDDLPSTWQTNYVPNTSLQRVMGSNFYGEVERPEDMPLPCFVGENAIHNNNHQGAPPQAPRRDVKIKVEHFDGELDPEKYLEWEQETHHVLEHLGYNETEKVEVVSLHLRGSARAWWYRQKEERQRRGWPRIETWNQLKYLMKKKYVPEQHIEQMRLRVAMCKQGPHSPIQFFNELENVSYKAGIHHTQQSLRTQFLAGLNQEVRDGVECLQIEDPTRLVNAAQLFYNQLQRKKKQAWGSNPQKRYTPNPSSNPKTFSSNPSFQPRGATNSTKNEANVSRKPTVGNSQSQRPSEVKCFKCQGRGHIAWDCTNSKAVYYTTQGYVTDDEDAEEEVVPTQVEEEQNHGESYAEEFVQPEMEQAYAYVNQKDVLTLQEAPRTDQRETIFHTRCTVRNQCINMIIDSGSSCNLINARVVHDLQLPTKLRTLQYGLNGINSGASQLITHTCDVHITIGSYKDVITCDVSQMECTHILLGRPWLFDKKVIYDGYLNTYAFNHLGRRFTLLPLSPHEVLQDQVRRNQARAIDEARRASKNREKEDGLVEERRGKSSGAPKASNVPKESRENVKKPGPQGKVEHRALTLGTMTRVQNGRRVAHDRGEVDLDQQAKSALSGSTQRGVDLDPRPKPALRFDPRGVEIDPKGVEPCDRLHLSGYIVEVS